MTKKSSLPAGMQPTRVIGANPPDPNERVPQPETDRWDDSPPAAKNDKSAYSALETGRPDEEAGSGIHDHERSQRQSGPLQQEGQGNRQNDALAELEEMEPDLDLDDTENAD